MASSNPKPWAKLYHTRRWERRSRLNLEMHKHLCQECLRNGKVEPATLSHHVNEYRESFSELDFWYGELTALCAGCHADIHGYNKPKDYQADIGSDGYALDPNHPMNRFESLSYEERMAIMNEREGKRR
jgi:5-methylcytosine-specific restriction enzyme A